MYYHWIDLANKCISDYNQKEGTHLPSITSSRNRSSEGYLVYCATLPIARRFIRRNKSITSPVPYTNPIRNNWIDAKYSELFKQYFTKHCPFKDIQSKLSPTTRGVPIEKNAPWDGAIALDNTFMCNHIKRYSEFSMDEKLNFVMHVDDVRYKIYGHMEQFHKYLNFIPSDADARRACGRYLGSYMAKFINKLNMRAKLVIEKRLYKPSYTYNRSLTLNRV